MNIARSIGAPLKIDKNTLEGNFDHCARILIDVDLSTEIPASLMIEREGHKFFINLIYEKLTEFYRNCLAVGHAFSNCKKNHMAKSSGISKQQPNKAPSQKQ